MKKLLDKIVVLDLEATAFKGPEAPPTRRGQEIIEIGARLLDISTQTVESTGYFDSLLIRPENSEISPLCTSLTSITPEMVEDAPRLRDVVDGMIDALDSKKRVFASYGDFDRIQFSMECRDKEIAYPFGPRHINVKTLIALTMGWEQEVGMAEALVRLGLPLKGTHHRAGDDSFNIALILSRALWGEA